MHRKGNTGVLPIAWTLTIRSCNPWLPAHQHKSQCGIDLSVPFPSLLICAFLFLFFSCLFFFSFFGHTANGTGCHSTIQSVSLIASSLRTLVQQPSSHDNNRSPLPPFLPFIRILRSHYFLVRLPPSHVSSIVFHHIPKQHHQHSDPPFPIPGHYNESNHTNCTSQFATI